MSAVSRIHQKLYGMLTVLATVLVASCAVMPQPLTREALPDLPFPILVQRAGSYAGNTVILGGYVIEVRQTAGESRLVAIQAPLGLGQKPRSKDLSRGRLIVHYAGFLDPEVYERGRKITVGGRLLGSSATEAGPEAYPYVRIQAESVYLWPPERPAPPPAYWDPWWNPYPYRWYWGFRLN
ncbi:MAG: Slp family lipoprotein [Desulfobacteraceae bacterium]|nr:Slp family lipoprotein [Desulfobacteraceae bacterium]